MMKLKEILDSIPPERRQKAIERVKATLKARHAILRKYSHLFTDDPEPTTSETETRNEPKPNE